MISTPMAIKGIKKSVGVIKPLFTVLVILLFIWLSYTSSIQGRILGVVILALVLWSLYPNRHFSSSIIIIALLAFFEASLSLDEFINSLFSTYGGSGFWIIISGFVLSEGMESSGLARRLALLVFTSLRGNTNNVILSIALANLVIAPLSPSTTAKAFLLLPICVNLVEALDVGDGRSGYAAAVMIMAMAANNICSTGFLTATVPNPISANYIREVIGINLGWFEWLRMAFPLTLILLVTSWLICILMFKPKVDMPPDALDQIRFLNRELGSLSKQEILVSLVFSISLLLLITEEIHGLNAGLISLLISLILFVPKIGVIKLKGFTGDIPWGSIALFAASMFMSKAIGRWNALDPISLSIFKLFNLSNLSVAAFTAIVIAISMFGHIAFTSTTVYATVMIPLSISLASLSGVKPQLVSIPLAFLTPIAVILPVNTIPNIVFYKSGYFSQRQMIAYGLLVSVISTIIILGLGLTYWSSIDLV